MVQHSILVIDDDAEIRNALQLVLKKAGYHPLLAEGGQAAIALMERDEQAAGVAAILCDLEMPGMNGATVIAHFQRHHPMIPVLVLSGAAPAQFLDAVGQQGVGDWIRKPATNETVLEKVRGAVHLFEHQPPELRATGSNPVRRTNTKKTQKPPTSRTYPVGR
jgi:two-component system, NtrC family, nitrogen regulation response regulator NtrX